MTKKCRENAYGIRKTRKDPCFSFFKKLKNRGEEGRKSVQH